MKNQDQSSARAKSTQSNEWGEDAFSPNHELISHALLILLVTLPLVVIGVFAIRSVYTESLVDAQNDQANQQWLLQSIDRELVANIDQHVEQYLTEFSRLSVNDSDLRWWLFKHSSLELLMVYNFNGEQIFPPSDNQSTTVQELRLIEQLRPEFAAIRNREESYAAHRTMVKGIDGPKLLHCQPTTQWYVCLLVNTSGLQEWLQQSLARVAWLPTSQVSVLMQGLDEPVIPVPKGTLSSNPKPSARMAFDFWDIELYESQSETVSNRPLLMAGLLLPLFFLLLACAYGLYRLEKNRRAQALAQQQFTAELAHEIRTPLANIRLYLDLMKKTFDSSQVEHSSVIISEVGRLSLLVDNAMLLERPAQSFSGFEVPPVDPDQVIQKIIGTLSPILEEHACKVQLELAIAEPLRFDQDALQRVLINLLDNARKYAGQSTVRLTSMLNERTISIDLYDQGPGLPKGLWDRLQGRAHQRINSGGQGFGLGLRVCVCLCRRSGGRLYYKTGSAGGCHFQILLPVFQQQASD